MRRVATGWKAHIRFLMRLNFSLRRHGWLWGPQSLVRGSFSGDKAEKKNEFGHLTSSGEDV